MGEAQDKLLELASVAGYKRTSKSGKTVYVRAYTSSVRAAVDKFVAKSKDMGGPGGQGWFTEGEARSFAQQHNVDPVKFLGALKQKKHGLREENFGAASGGPEAPTKGKGPLKTTGKGFPNSGGVDDSPVKNRSLWNSLNSADEAQVTGIKKAQTDAARAKGAAQGAALEKAGLPKAKPGWNAHSTHGGLDRAQGAAQGAALEKASLPTKSEFHKSLRKSADEAQVDGIKKALGTDETKFAGMPSGSDAEMAKSLAASDKLSDQEAAKVYAHPKGRAAIDAAVARFNAGQNINEAINPMIMYVDGKPPELGLHAPISAFAATSAVQTELGRRKDAYKRAAHDAQNTGFDAMESGSPKDEGDAAVAHRRAAALAPSEAQRKTHLDIARRHEERSALLKKKTGLTVLDPTGYHRYTGPAQGKLLRLAGLETADDDLDDVETAVNRVQADLDELSDEALRRLDNAVDAELQARGIPDDGTGTTAPDLTGPGMGGRVTRTSTLKYE